MTPTTAAIGISFMARPKKRHITINSTLVITDENRVFAPLAKFSLLCPTNTHPPNPPVSPVAIFAIPCTRLSRNESPFMPKAASVSLTIIRDSNNPVNAIAAENGSIFRRLSASYFILLDDTESSDIREGRSDFNSPVSFTRSIL